MHQPWSWLLHAKCKKKKKLSRLLVGKVRELRSAALALAELNSALCSLNTAQSNNGGWASAFGNCHKVLRKAVTKGLPSTQSL